MIQSKLNVKIAHNISQLDKLCQEIINSGEDTLGLDTETSIIQKKNEISLIQIATTSVCYLFKMFEIINNSEFIGEYPESFKKIMGGNYIKVGFAIHNDMMKIKQFTNVKCINSIDVQLILKSKRYPFSSLEKVAKYFFPYEFRADGKQNTKIHTKWEYDVYTKDMILYSALDARYSLFCYWKALYAPIYDCKNITNSINNENNNYKTGNEI